MSISVDTYRARIGTFSSEMIPMKRRHKKCHSRIVNIRSIIKFSIMTMVVCISVYGIGENRMGYKIKLKTGGTTSPSLVTGRPFKIDNNFLARYTFGNRRHFGLKICHWNAGSSHLINKINEIENVMASYKPHAFGISETSFHQGQVPPTIDDYKVYFADTLKNPDLSVSRVSVFVHKDIQAKLRPDLMSSKFSSVWLELGHQHQRKVLLCNLYREWQYLNQSDDVSKSIPAQYERWSGFIDQWEMALNEGKEVLVVGDVNLDFLKFDNSLTSNIQVYRLQNFAQLIFDRIYSQGVVQCIKEPTHFWPGQEPSCIDHMYTNHPEKLSHPRVIANGGSDHKLILCTRYTKQIVSKPRMICKRSYKNFNPEIFLQEVRGLPLWQVYSCEDPEVAVETLTSFLNEILGRLAPLKTFQVRKHYCPWITDYTKNLIYQRNLAQVEAQKFNKNTDWEVYRVLRNQVNSRLKKEKLLWQKKKMVEVSSDPSNSWKSVKGWLGWTTGGPPKQLFDGVRLCNKPSELSNIMNRFFVDKVKNIRCELPFSADDPLSSVKKLMKDKKCKLKFKTVHPDIVLEIINSLKNKKSCGSDNIDSYIVKLAKHELLPAITHIINLSITTNCFPQQWKLAKVVPLLKKENPTLPENYRPVALLCIFSKIIESVIFKQVISYMEENALLHRSHHGFRGQHSTCSALLEMYDGWLTASSRNQIAATIMLDLSAAFDVVDHKILLDKLKIYGLEKSAIEWVDSYLSGRKQVVLVDGHISDELTLEVGVPQGSILGPLLYVIFTNELPNVLDDSLRNPDSSVVCYADDTTMSLFNEDPIVLKRSVDESYKLVSNYMAMNRLKLNSSKTHLMVLRSSEKHKRDGTLGIELNTGNEIIQPSDHQKLLGVFVSQDLRWDHHIRSSVSVLTSRLNALKIISSVASFNVRKIMANGIFMSSLIYVIQLWGGANKSLISLLQIQQNKAARFVTHLGHRTSVKILLQQCGWLSVRQLVIYHDCLFVYKVMQYSKPVYFQEKFQSHSQFEPFEEPVSFRTRLNCTGGIRMDGKTKSDLNRQSFVHVSSQAWNSLPAQIRQAQKIDSFKRSLKEWIQQHIDIE